jgi:hypothetical protein
MLTATFRSGIVTLEIDVLGGLADVRFGSKAEILNPSTKCLLAPENGHAFLWVHALTIVAGGHNGARSAGHRRRSDGCRADPDRVGCANSKK